MKDFKPEVETKIRTKTATSTKITLTTAIIAGIMTVVAFVITMLNL